jgi:hypothetical protein
MRSHGEVDQVHDVEIGGDMTKDQRPSEQQGETRLDSETVADLDVSNGEVDEVRGGACPKSRPVIGISGGGTCAERR